MEAHVAKTADHVITFLHEMFLESFHFVQYFCWFEHWNCRFLEGNVGATVEVGSAGADGFDEFLFGLVHLHGTSQPGSSESKPVGTTKYLRPNNPSNSPSRKSESLCKTVNDQHVVLIHIFNIIRCGNCGPVTIGRIVVATIELVHDQRCSITANVLDLCKLRVLHNFTGRVSWVRSKNDGCATGDLFSYLVGMDVIAIRLYKRRRDSSEL